MGDVVGVGPKAPATRTSENAVKQNFNFGEYLLRTRVNTNARTQPAFDQESSPPTSGFPLARE